MVVVAVEMVDTSETLLSDTAEWVADAAKGKDEDGHDCEASGTMAANLI